MDEHRKRGGGHGRHREVTDEAGAAIRAETRSFEAQLTAHAMSRARTRGDTTVNAADVRTAVGRLRSGDRRLAAAGTAGGAGVTLVATVLAAPAMPAGQLVSVLWAAGVALAVAVFLARGA
jgi:histone H3/H4